ncbi:Photosystem I assembly protein Ycf3 [Candidatus Lokiarchaeum ossiferum]|uniref:Photosystem I assembly protein Ycf3 n=1 Tax=Candidatus Lokiarchaeum ossiferum TaxID=2951803 RepID=A0ABY6HUB5_9ARCH|nr:Photosystem I assembly protein Ycf3 [Candidatus Lokiarchaeum sp. B-35]
MSLNHSSGKNQREISEKRLNNLKSHLEEYIITKNETQIMEEMVYINHFVHFTENSEKYINTFCDIATIFWSYERTKEVRKILIKIEEVLTVKNDPDLRRKYLAKIKLCWGCLEAFLGNFDEAHELFNQGYEKSTDLQLKALILINSGILYSISGNNDIAQSKYHESLLIFEKLQNNIGTSLVLNHLGSLDLNLGQFDDAMIHFRKSVGIREELEQHALLIPVLNNVGEVYRIWGEIDTALTYYQRSLKIQQEYDEEKRKLVHELQGFEWVLEPWSYGTINIIKALENHKAILLFNLGLIYQSKGDFSRAFSYFQQSLEIDKQVEDNQVTVETLFQLIFLACENGYCGEAIAYFDEIQRIYLENKNSSILISQYYLVSNALILRSNENIKDYAESLEILEEIRTQEIISQDLKRYTLSFLMEGYLTELKLFNNPKIFKKAHNLASELEELAWEEKSTILLLFIKQIRAKLAFIQDKLPQSRNFLETGLEIAKTKKYWQFAGFFFRELANLSQHEKKLLNEEKGKISMGERIAIAKLDVIISHISQNQIANITEFPDYALETIKGMLFEMSDLGPIPVISESVEHLLPMDQSNETLNAVLLQKLALLYTIAIGQGNSPNYGLFGPLPIPDYSGYVALTYSFKIHDQKIQDARMKEKTFAVLCFLMPEDFVPFFSERDQIIKHLNEAISDLSDIGEITLEWIRGIKQKIIELK